MFPFDATNSPTDVEFANIDADVEFIELFTVLLPIKRLSVVNDTLGPTETAVVLTIVVPVTTLVGVTFTDPVVLETLRKVLFAIAFTVEFPIDKVSVVNDTFAPTETAEVLTIVVPVTMLVGVTLIDPDVLATLRTVLFAVEFTVLLPNEIVLEVTETFEPTATVEVFTTVIPAVIPTAFTFTIDVLFAT